MKKLSSDMTFEKTQIHHKKLIILFLIGIILSIFGISLAFVNSTHFFGFIAAASSFTLGLVGCFYLSRIPINKEDRTWGCLPKKNRSKMYMRLFFFILYFLFITFVAIFVLLKIITIFKAPTVTSMPSRCENNGCAKIMVFRENHRDENVNTKHLFSIKHIGIQNTNDLILSWVDKQTQARIEYTEISLEKRSFFHVNYASIFFGFVDDMFIEAIPCTESSGGAQEISFALNIQSQSRIGNNDFGVNPSRIAGFLEWMSGQVPDNHIAHRHNACLAKDPNEEEEEEDEIQVTE